MRKNRPDDIQATEGLEGEDEISATDDQPNTEIDSQKVEKAEAELRVLKEYLKKQQSQKNDSNQKGSNR
ncbi:MAG: hypothetical protein HQ508_00945 [Candidatus Marinimicrobia bacterium]|nr:hypothetical protein [Candidatus Neomarinimicrobiota bacterium]